MPRFTEMLVRGMRLRGHTVKLWAPQARFFRFPVPVAMKKWMGYVDQYLIFPMESRSFVQSCSPDTLFVFVDQALGPWVPLVAHRPHVIHCHDFLAQQSAMGQIPENPTGWTGRHYQAMIRRGYSRGKNFISVSEKTREDLHHFLAVPPACSEVVYNGLNQPFKLIDPLEARKSLGRMIGLDLKEGFLLHVGGNQWYKNRIGVIEIYNAWRSLATEKLPLLMIGQPPSGNLRHVYEQSVYKEDIYLLSHMEDDAVRLAYAGASVFLFPSLAEGFGWPIAEAMASGCPVITTDAAPMSIVAGKAGFLMPRRPRETANVTSWATNAAHLVKDVLGQTPAQRRASRDAGLRNIKRFDTAMALDRVEKIYKNILQTSRSI